MLGILGRVKRRPSYLQDMNLALAISLLVLACLYADFSNAEVSEVAKQAAIAQEAEEKVNPLADRINKLEKPLFTPFIELYVLEEMKQLRIDFANQKRELMQEVMDREHSAIDRAINYSSNTVTYFFYLIAGASSVMLLVGWNSLREIKDRVHTLADEEISKLVSVYEDRLHAIEKQLNQKTQHIEENREEIELTQGIQSLWLRAAQDTNASSKIEIYDDILKLRHDDCEALTYKADAVLELDEPQWAASLCHQALKIDPENSHAFYQLACAYTALEHYDDALKYLNEAVSRKESYRDDILCDDALEPLVKDPIFEGFSEHWGIKVV